MGKRGLAGLVYEVRVGLHYAQEHRSVPAGGLIATCTDGLCPQLLETEDQVGRHSRFATFGEEVPASEVPDLVRAGREVWSFGYGADLEPDEFTTIEPGDLIWFDGSSIGRAVVDSWAPFRVRPK